MKWEDLTLGDLVALRDYIMLRDSVSDTVDDNLRAIHDECEKRINQKCEELITALSPSSSNIG